MDNEFLGISKFSSIFNNSFINNDFHNNGKAYLIFLVLPLLLIVYTRYYLDLVYDYHFHYL